MEAYGYSVGILLLDVKVPLIPGDAGNSRSFEYPVMYRAVPGLDWEHCRGDANGLVEKAVAAAKALDEQGVKAIAGNAGAMLRFQDAVSAAVDLPVCLSSLSQLPYIANAFEDSQPIGVICSDSGAVGQSLLDAGGIQCKNPVVFQGMEDQPEFRSAVLEQKGTLDSDRLRDETVAVARALADGNAGMGALLLECGMLSPYAKAVQDETGLSVFDCVSMIDYLQWSTHQKEETGYY